MSVSPAELLRLHRELDRTSRTNKSGRFLSGWQTTHPYAGRYLNSTHVVAQDPGALQSYNFLSDSSSLTDAITLFHARTDGVAYARDAVYVSSGSSPFCWALSSH